MKNYQASQLIPIGKIGELLVCADLLMKGFNAFLVSDSASPFDIIVSVCEKLLKVQVKTTVKETIHYSKDRELSIPTFVFKTGVCGWEGLKKQTNKNVDIYALVVLSTKSIAYVPFDKMRSNVSLRVPHLRGTYYNERGNKLGESIENMVQDGLCRKDIANQLDVSISTVDKRKGKRLSKSGYNKGKYFDECTLPKCLDQIFPGNFTFHKEIDLYKQ